MDRPLVTVALAALTGSLLAAMLPRELGSFLTCLTLICATLALLSWANPKAEGRRRGVAPALLTIALLSALNGIAQRPSPELRREDTRALTLAIEARPRATRSGFRVRARELHYGVRSDLIELQVYGPAELHRGEIIAAYGRRRACRGWVYGPSIETVGLSPRRLAAPLDALAARMSHAIHEGSLRHPALIASLVLGERGRLPRSTRDLMRRSGTSHLLAVSGLHVGFVAFLALLLTRLLPIGMRLRCTAAILAVLGYAAIVGLRPSTLRATVLALGFLAAQLVHRKGEVWNLLALAALVVLACDPSAPFNAGCQLSFITTAALIAFADDIGRFVEPSPAHPLEGLIWPGAPLGQRLRIAAEAWRGRTRRALQRWGGRSLGISALAFFASAPLALVHFGICSPNSIVANCLAVPLFFLILATALAGALLGAISPFLGALPLAFSDALIELLLRGLSCLDVVPGGSFSLPPGHLLVSPWLPLSLVVCVVFVRGFRRPRVAVLILLALLWLPASRPVSGPGVGSGGAKRLRRDRVEGGQRSVRQALRAWMRS